MKPIPSPTGNLFLDRVIADGAALDTHPEARVNLQKGQVLGHAADTESHMHFPVDVLVSLSWNLESGSTAEFRQIGREGFVGFPGLMGPGTAQTSAVVQTDGLAYRIRTQIIQQAFEDSPAFRRVTLQYMQALMQEAAQTVICNRFHTIIQQYSRSLLAASDRLGSRTVLLTHEQLAVAIGCRREAVSIAAAKLQQAGSIHYAYGKIDIVDRTALLAHSCECYDAVKSAFAVFHRTAPPSEPG